MNGLFIFLGESFRWGPQLTRVRGIPKTKKGQIEAADSHVRFIDHIKEKYNMNKTDVFVSSYHTAFNNDLTTVYGDKLIGSVFLKKLVGLNGLFTETLKHIENIDQYDFVFYIRVDIFLKEHLFEIFEPKLDVIQVPCLTWWLHHRWKGYPRVSDTMLYIPKKFFKHINRITICHETWYLMASRWKLVDKFDFDVMINTYHDSNTSKDKNPLYYIVNRFQKKVTCSEGRIFDKHTFLYQENKK